MTSMTAFAVLTAACAVAAPSAFAQTYVAGGYSHMEVETVGGGDLTFGALTVRVGHQLNPFLAIEGEGSVGIDEETYPIGIPPGQVEASLDYQLGAFVVGKLPLGDAVSVFGRAGYAKTLLSDPGGAAEPGEDFALGAGVELTLIPGLTTRLDYTDYESEVRTLSLTAGVKF